MGSMGSKHSTIMIDHDTPIQVTITSNLCPIDVDLPIRDFLSNSINEDKIIGVDIEWSSSRNQISVLSLCDGKSCLILSLSTTSSTHLSSQLSSLYNFLRLPDYIFVGTGIKAALPKLEEDYRLGFRNVVELDPLALRGVHIPRSSSSVGFRDWNYDYGLSEEQITSIAFTAFAYFKIGCQL